VNSGWLAIVSILSVYDISKAIDEKGKVIEPLIDYADGVIRYLPFVKEKHCQIDDAAFLKPSESV